jgi:hypothetical protein
VRFRVSNKHAAQIIGLSLICSLPGRVCSAQSSQHGAARPSWAGADPSAEPLTPAPPAEPTGNHASARVSTPPRINLGAGTLTIEAYDATLPQILQAVAEKSGMQILNMPPAGPRIFGQYGPGESRQVLVDLIKASGLNFIMVGRIRQGVPRELILQVPSQTSESQQRSTGSRGPETPTPGGEGNRVTTDPIAATDLGPGALSPTPADNVPESDRIEQNRQRLEHIQEQLQKSAPE